VPHTPSLADAWIAAAPQGETGTSSTITNNSSSSSSSSSNGDAASSQAQPQ
jgi:hypothetical protein